MGAGASSHRRATYELPYANEAEALADGKTQGEIDLWKNDHQINRGSSIIDADNLEGTTINDRFCITQDHGALVSSGASMIFPAL